MNDSELKKEKGKKKNTRQKYFECSRCGYVSILRDSFCPVCAKEGIEVKMK